MAGVVAGDVFAMLGELDSEAAERRTVGSGHVAFDDGARLQPPEMLGPLDRLGVEEGSWASPVPRDLSRMSRVMSSLETPSLCAKVQFGMEPMPQQDRRSATAATSSQPT